MKNLLSAYYYPAENTVRLNVEEDGFRRPEPVMLSALPLDYQEIANLGLAWVQAEVGGAISKLIIEKGPEVATADGAFSCSFRVSVTATDARGEQSRELTSSPGPITDGIKILWDYLTTQIG